MCFKCPSRDETVIYTGYQRSGKTLSLAEFIVNCDDIPDTYQLTNYMSDWAEYFFKNRPITKADLREALTLFNK